MNAAIFEHTLKHAERDARHARKAAEKQQHDLEKAIEKKEKQQRDNERRIAHAQEKLDKERKHLN